MRPGRFLTSRRALYIGFGGLLAIVVLMAWKSARVISAIEPESTRVRALSRERDAYLDAIRLDLSESASAIRDYLLDRDPASAARTRSRLESLRASFESAAARYSAGVPPAEEPVWREFEEGARGYWDTLDPVFDWDAEVRRRKAEAYLRDEVFPRRRELIHLASTVDRLDERNFRQSEANISVLFSQFRKEMTLSAFLAVALGGLLAFGSMRRILELERTADRRLQEVGRGRLELQNLSARLVAVQEEERRRVARELHDEIGQAISAVLVELGRVESRLPPGESDERAAIAGARELANRAVSQVRDMALLLRPSMLDDLGLAPALKWQAREISRRAGLKVKVAADDSADDLPDEYRTCIYRVVQEALNNAARHAQASSARVDVRRTEGEVRVSIQDDGAGFDPSQERGMGILGMEERVKSLGGVFRIDSNRGSGSIVSLLLPLDRAAAGGVGA